MARSTEVGRRSGALVAAAVALVLATPGATWWIVQAVTHQPIADPDYAIRPVPIDPAGKLALGLSAVAIAGGSLLALVVAGRRQWLRPGWWSLLGPLVAVGAIVGGGWAAMTAPVVGVNFGAALLYFVGPPAILGLLGWAAVSGFRLWREGGPP